MLNCTVHAILIQNTAAIGACAAPLICQTLLARGIPWAHFYLGSLVLSALNTTLLTLAFRPSRKESADERQRYLNISSRSAQTSTKVRSTCASEKRPEQTSTEKTTQDLKEPPTSVIDSTGASAPSPTTVKDISGQSQSGSAGLARLTSC